MLCVSFVTGEVPPPRSEGVMVFCRRNVRKGASLRWETFEIGELWRTSVVGEELSRVECASPRQMINKRFRALNV